MEDPEIPHARVAKKISTTPENVSFVVSRFNDTSEAVIIRNVWMDRVEMFALTETDKLKTIKPEELRFTQGVIEGLRLAATAIEQR